jgi:hypothetical protein
LLGLLPGGVTNLRDRVLFACSLDEVRRWNCAVPAGLSSWCAARGVGGRFSNR